MFANVRPGEGQGHRDQGQAKVRDVKYEAKNKDTDFGLKDQVQTNITILQ